MKPKRRVLADGSRICRPRRYAHREDLPEGPDVPAVIFGLAQCMEEPETSEYSSSFPDATGRYEGDGAFWCMNQAGLHIEAWFSRELRGGERVRRRVSRYEGDFDPASGTFTLHTKAGKTVGEMTVPTDYAKSRTIDIAFSDGSKYQMKVVSQRATWSDRLVTTWKHANLEATHARMRGIVESEHAPLSQEQIGKLREHLQSPELDEILRALFRESPEETNQSAIRTQLKQLLKFYTGHEYDPGNLVNAPFAPADRERVRAHAFRMLHGSRLTLMGPGGAQDNLTRYEWFQRVMLYNRKYAADAFNLPLERWFGVEPSQPFRYRLSFLGAAYMFNVGIPFSKKVTDKMKKLADKLPKDVGREYFKKKVIGRVENVLNLSAGGKRIAGLLTVTSEQPAGWRYNYVVEMGYAATGKSGGGFAWDESIRAKGWCETPVEWLPQDFAGDITHFAGAFARWDGKLAKDQFVWNLTGSGPDRATQLIFDKVESDIGTDWLGLGYGSVWGADDQIDPPLLRKRFRDLRHEQIVGDLEDVDFVLGSATVREEGRKKLREFAANELAELRDPASHLSIVGFADRIDRRWYNQLLSSMRAANVLTALRDCTGKSLKLKTDVLGVGEDALAFLDTLFHFPDEKGSPEWRRVFAVLNGMASVTLKVRDLKDVK